MHSFTPVFLDVGRPWHAGVLFNRDARLAEPLLRLLRAEGDLVVGCNEPYAVTDTSDYSVNHHGAARDLPHVEIEIRQDLIADEAGQIAWAQRLARLLPLAAAELSPHRRRQPGTVTMGDVRRARSLRCGAREAGDRRGRVLPPRGRALTPPPRGEPLMTESACAQR